MGTWPASTGKRAWGTGSSIPPVSAGVRRRTRDHGDDPDNPFYGRAYDGVESKTWRAYRKTGVEPLEVAVEFAHQHGIELHAAYRVAGFHFPVPHYSETKGSFFEQHPELVCVDREGNPLPRISYAFPQTRKYVLSLLRETASNYAIDGVALLYNRRPPLVAYEAPIVEGFQAEYGEDPRKLDSLDERWLRYRSTFLTRFMRELRAMLDDVAREQGRSRLAVTAVVCRPGENILHGMDLKTWVREGLVDTLIPYSSSVRLNSFVPAWDDPRDVEHFVSLVEGTDCTLALNMMPRSMTSREYYDMAYRLYRSGVERFFFWDGLGRTRRSGPVAPGGSHRTPLRGGAMVQKGKAQPPPGRFTPVDSGRMGPQIGNSRIEAGRVRVSEVESRSRFLPATGDDAFTSPKSDLSVLPLGQLELPPGLRLFKLTQWGI